MKKPKTNRLFIRVDEDKKKELKQVADKAGLTISELIMSRIDNLPIKDYQKENEFLSKLNELTQEFGYIGHNINQVTTAIHQINNSVRVPGREFQELSEHLEHFHSARTELSEALKQIFFK